MRQVGEQEMAGMKVTLLAVRMGEMFALQTPHHALGGRMGGPHQIVSRGQQQDGAVDVFYLDASFLRRRRHAAITGTHIQAEAFQAVAPYPPPVHPQRTIRQVLPAPCEGRTIEQPFAGRNLQTLYADVQRADGGNPAYRRNQAGGQQRQLRPHRNAPDTDTGKAAPVQPARRGFDGFDGNLRQVLRQMRLPVIRQRQRVQAVIGKGGGKLLRGLKVAVAAAENDDGLVGNGILPAAVKFGGQTVLRV